MVNHGWPSTTMLPRKLDNGPDFQPWLTINYHASKKTWPWSRFSTMDDHGWQSTTLLPRKLDHGPVFQLWMTMVNSWLQIWFSKVYHGWSWSFHHGHNHKNMIKYQQMFTFHQVLIYTHDSVCGMTKSTRLPLLSNIQYNSFITEPISQI
jgi:hypothetical protein